MKKFIIRGLCFAAIALMLLYVLNFFYVKTNGFKSLNGTHKFSTVPGGIEVVNLGSSHGEFGFDYAEIDAVKGYNLGLRGQSHYFDLQVLRKCSDNLAADCVVIIPVSCFSLLQGTGREQRILYYRVLGYGSIPGHDPIEYVKFKLLPILSASFDAKYLINDKESIDADIFSRQGPDEEFYRLNALFYYGLFDELKKAGADNEGNVKTLGEIIDHCRENGFQPVLVTTPFTDFYNDWYSKEDLSKFHAAIDGLREKYDVPYLDYSHDKRFSKTLELFADSDHLNPVGRRMFTRILLGDLGIIQGAREEESKPDREATNDY